MTRRQHIATFWALFVVFEEGARVVLVVSWLLVLMVKRPAITGLTPQYRARRLKLPGRLTRALARK